MTAAAARQEKLPCIEDGQSALAIGLILDLDLCDGRCGGSGRCPAARWPVGNGRTSPRLSACWFSPDRSWADLFAADAAFGAMHGRVGDGRHSAPCRIRLEVSLGCMTVSGCPVIAVGIGLVAVKPAQCAGGGVDPPGRAAMSLALVRIAEAAREIVAGLSTARVRVYGHAGCRSCLSNGAARGRLTTGADPSLDVLSRVMFGNRMVRWTDLNVEGRRCSLRHPKAVFEICDDR